MSFRENYSSGTKWEKEFGYSRGVRAGDLIFISGTTSVRNGEIVGEGNIAKQTRTCLEIIKESVEKLGGALSDVVRTRMYVADIGQSAAIGAVYSEFFSGICPAATMLKVSGLIYDKLLIEIEADAVISGKK